MFRTRKPRWLKNERNLLNLHVIPTASDGKLSDEETEINVKHLPTPNVIQITPSDDSNNSNKSISKQSGLISSLENKIDTEQKVKSQVKKPPIAQPSVQTDNSHWYDSNCEDANLSPENESEKMEGVSDTPGEENYFEEVEVASVEGDPRQEILVRFRKSKPFYLKYKKKGLFKPKIYNVADPTFVNCMNVQDDVDVDVISEAEYEYETDCLERSDSQEMLNTILEVDESEVDSDHSDSQEMLNEIVEGDDSTDGDPVGKNLERDELCDGDKMKTDLEEEELGDGDQMEKNLEGNESGCNDDQIEMDLEGNESKCEFSQMETDGIKVEGKDNKEIEIIDISGDETQEENETLLEDSTDLESMKRIYKTCIKGNDDFSQGISSIQNNLNLWKSHLIGLEYLIEIKNASQRDVDVKHYCVLCCEDLRIQEFPAISIINHINSNKHIVSYLEKHFPALGFKFAESGDCNVILLQRLSEEINQRFGYYFMCITNSKYYAGHADKIKEMIKNAYHPNEKDLKLDKNALKKNVDSNLKVEVQSIISDIIQKIPPPTEVGKAGSDIKNKNALDHKSAVIKPQKNLYFNRYRGSSSLSSYVQLNSFASSAFKKSGKKGSISKSGEKLPAGTKEDSGENIIKRLCTSSEEKGGGNVVKELSDSTKEKSDEEIMKGSPVSIKEKRDEKVVKGSPASIKEKSDKKFVKGSPPSIKEKSDEKFVKGSPVSIKEKSDEKIVKGLSASPKEKSDEKIVKGLPTITKEKSDEKIVKELPTITKEKSDEKIVKGLPTITKQTCVGKDVKGLPTITKGTCVGKDVKCLPTITRGTCVGKDVKCLPTITRGTCVRKNVKCLPTIAKETSVRKDAKGLTTKETYDTTDMKGFSVGSKEICVEGLSSLTNVTCDEKVVETENTSEEVESGTTVADKVVSAPSQKAHRIREPVLLKTSALHSKYCRKRILGKDSSRLKLAAKATAKDEFVSGVSNKSRVKNKSVTVSARCDTSKKVPEKLKLVKAIKNSSQKMNIFNKIPFVQKASVASKPSVVKHSGLHHRIIHKKGSESNSTDQIDALRDFTSVWRPITRTSSPGKSSISKSTRLVRSPDKKSKSPVRRNVRKRSKSPLERIKSPLRLVTKQSFETIIGRYPRIPLRRKSRSPVKRKSRSPARRKSRSPIRRKSRSPFWKSSRSPVRRRSRSPMKRHSRSPLRRRSRSPLRRRSRSPLRLHSRSPLRLRSRSPLRLRSRSPLRRRSRSPFRRRSRSPLRRHSRSPFRHLSRSPIKRRSRSPVEKHSRSPIRKYSGITKYRSDHSPDLEHDVRERFNSEERYLNSVYNFKHLSSRASEFSKESSKRNTSDKFKSHTFTPNSVRDSSDLDPVSDEDESIYFNDKHLHTEEVNIPQSSKSMLTKLLQKFSMTDASPSDPALNKLMQFMEAHSSEIQDFIGSQSKPFNMSVTKANSSVQDRSLVLQQYLLSNLAGSSQEPTLPSPAAPNIQPKFIQPSFMQVAPGFAHPPNLPPPNVSPQPIQQRFFPPNVNVPPPQLYPQPINQPPQDFSPKLNVPPEIMFKDLKATVTKLFGANEDARKQEKPQASMLHLKPGYVTEPDPDKWDLNHPDTPKYNASVGSKKNEFNRIPQDPSIQEEIPMFNNSVPAGQFFGGRGMNRPQIPSVPIPPPDAKVSFCEVSHSPKGNLFPVVNAHMNSNFNPIASRGGGSVSDVKVSLAQRLASVLVKVGMIDVPAPLLQEMLMKIGAFSSSPRQDISETEIVSILKRLGYL